MSFVKFHAAITMAFSFAIASVSAQTEPAPVPRAKVGYVNYGAIFKNYDKAADYKKEIEDIVKPLLPEATGIKIEMANLKRVVESATASPEEAVNARDGIGKHQRRLDELDKIALDMIGKLQEVHLVTLWADIKVAITKHAKSQDLDVVLANADGVPETDDFPHVKRKINALDAGGTFPIYIRPGIDITSDVVAQLNKAYRKQKRAAASPSGSPK